MYVKQTNLKVHFSGLWDGHTALGNQLLRIGGFSPAPHFFLFKTKNVSRKGEKSGYITHEMCLGAYCLTET